MEANGTVKICGLHRGMFALFGRRTSDSLAIHIPTCNKWIGVSECVHDFDESLEDSFVWLAPEVFKQVCVPNFRFNT